MKNLILRAAVLFLICVSSLKAEQMFSINLSKGFQSNMAEWTDVPGSTGVKGISIKPEVGKYGWCSIELGRRFDAGQYKLDFTISSLVDHSACVMLYAELAGNQVQITGPLIGSKGLAGKQQVFFYSPIAFDRLAIKKMDDSKNCGTTVSQIAITTLGRKEYPRLAAYREIMRYAAPWGLRSKSVETKNSVETYESWLDLRSSVADVCSRGDYLLRIVRLLKISDTESQVKTVKNATDCAKKAIIDNQQTDAGKWIPLAEQSLDTLQKLLEKKLGAKVTPESGTDIFTWLKAWKYWGVMGDYEYSEPTPYRAVYAAGRLAIVKPGEPLELSSTWTTSTYKNDRMTIRYSMLTPLTTVDVTDNRFKMTLADMGTIKFEPSVKMGEDGWFIIWGKLCGFLFVMNHRPSKVAMAGDELTVEFSKPSAIGFKQIDGKLRTTKLADYARFYQRIFLNQPVECVQIQKGNRIEQTYEYVERDCDWPIKPMTIAPVPHLVMVSQRVGSRLRVKLDQPIRRSIDGEGYIENRSTLSYALPKMPSVHSVGANVWDNNTDPSVYKTLQQQGCQTIRLVCGSQGQGPWDWKNIEKMKLGVQRNLQWIRQAGMKAGVDNHGWITEQDFTNRANLLEFIRRWKEIISWCKDYEDVVGWYDLMNEPLIFFEQKDVRPYAAFMKQAVRALRPSAGKTPFLVEVVNMANPIGAEFWEHLGDANIIVGYHDYWPHLFTHQLMVENGNASFPFTFYPSFMPMMEWTVPSWRNEKPGWTYWDRWKCDSISEPVYQLMIEKGCRFDCGEYGVVGHAGQHATRSGRLWMRHTMERFLRMGINHTVWSPAESSGFTWLVPEFKEETLRFWRQTSPAYNK